MQAPFDTALIRRRRARAAPGFADFAFLKERVAQALAERLLDTNRQFGLGLDIGCHRGEAGRALRATGRVAAMIAADSAWPFAAAAARPARVMPALVMPTPGVRALVTDEERLPIAPASLDLAVSALALHRVNDLPGALIQIRRTLRPDGLFLGALFGGGTLAELRTALAEAEIEVTGGASARVFPFADARDMAALMQRAGFALPVVDVDRHTVTYPDPFALLRDLRGMGETNALTARLRRPARRALFQRMAEIYAARFAGPDGRVRASFEVIYAAGWAPDESQPKPLKPGTAAHRLADALAEARKARTGVKGDAQKGDAKKGDTQGIAQNGGGDGAGGKGKDAD